LLSPKKIAEIPVEIVFCQLPWQMVFDVKNLVAMKINFFPLARIKQRFYIPLFFVIASRNGYLRFIFNNRLRYSYNTPK
jgi:hypothetical protein